MKKVIIALLIMVMLSTLVSCSVEEISMYSLMSEMSKLDSVESTNTISVSLDEKFMSETLESMPADLEELRKTLTSGFEIKYTSKLKKKPLEYEIVIELKNKGEGDFRKVTTLIGNETTTYVKLDDLLKFIKPYVISDDPVINETIDNIIAEVEYLKIDLNAIKYDNNSTSYDSSLLLGALQDKKSIELVDEFIETIKAAFKDFSFDIINKKDNGYELNLGPKDIKPLYVKLTKYIMNNIDLIAGKLTEKVNSMNNEQMKTLDETYGIKTEKDEIISGIEDFKEQVKEASSEEIEELENDEYFDEEIKNFEGSYFKYYVSKTEEGLYESTSDLKIQYEDEYSAKFAANIFAASKLKVLDDFTLAVPLKFTTVEDLNDIIYATVPIKAKKVKVNLNKKNADIEYNNGGKKNVKMQYITKNGYNYLPLRTIGETLGEEVGWDNSKREPYVIVKGERVVMKGLNKDNRTYVKVRDFEKIGYGISWDGESREVFIEKSSQYPFIDYFSYNKN